METSSFAIFEPDHHPVSDYDLLGQFAQQYFERMRRTGATPHVHTPIPEGFPATTTQTPSAQ